MSTISTAEGPFLSCVEAADAPRHDPAASAEGQPADHHPSQALSTVSTITPSCSVSATMLAPEPPATALESTATPSAAPSDPPQQPPVAEAAEPEQRQDRAPAASPPAASPQKAAQFTRDMEDRLRALRAIDEAHSKGQGEGLTDDERFEFEALVASYATFEEEGLKNLEAARAEKEKNQGTTHAADHSLAAWGKWFTSAAATTVAAVGSTTTTAVNGAFFWTSLLATAGPGLVGRAAGVTPNFLHWNGIVPNLILGALPVITQLGGRGNHLKKLHGQLDDPAGTVFAATPMSSQMGLVVACLTQNELDGFGVPGVEFAQGPHWLHEFGMPVSQFVQLDIIDNRAATTYATVRDAVARIHETISSNRVVYVHCKAGKGRSWMVVMCYLTTFGGMSFEDAKRLVRQRREQVNPSAAQEAYANSFMCKWHTERAVGDAGEVRVDGKALSQS